MSLRVFLRYAQKSPRAEETLEKIKAAVVANGWVPVVDIWDARPGTDWRRELVVGLADTHAGVILFTEEALSSFWVLQEASVMSFRCDLNKDYRFIPVLIEPMTPDRVKEHRFSDVALNHLQQIKGNPDAIAASVAAALGKTADVGEHDTLLGKLANELADALATQADAMLPVIGKHLDPNFHFVDSTTGRRAIGRLIAHGALRHGGNGIFDTIKRIAQRLGQASARNLLDLLAPLWIPVEKTASLGSSFKVGSTIPALNGRYLPSFTVPAFLNRMTWPNLEQQTLVPVPGGTDGATASLVEDILETVRITFGLRDHTDARRVLSKQRNDLVVLLPEPFPDQALVSELRAMFPGVGFLAAIDGVRPEIAPAGIALLPAVDLDDEADAVTQIAQSRKHIDKVTH